MRPRSWIVMAAIVATGLTLIPDSALAGGKGRGSSRVVTSPGAAGGAFHFPFSAPPTVGTFSPPHSPFVGGRAFRAPHHFRSHAGFPHKFTSPHKFAFPQRFGFPHRGLHAPVIVGALPSTVVTVVPAPEPVVPYVVSPAPVAYPPPLVVPAPRETVIQYPHGRYELRGDGVTTPYVWVWVPTLPPPPPPPVEPAPPPGPPAAAPPAPDRRTVIHRWTDERGVTHFTDDRENVPERYRDQLQRPAPPDALHR